MTMSGGETPSPVVPAHPLSHITQRELAACERYGFDYTNPSLIQELGELMKEREKIMNIERLIEDARMATTCAHIAANPQVEDYDHFLKSLGGEVSSYRQHRCDVRKIKRLAPESSMWVPADDGREMDDALLPLLKELRNPETSARVTKLLGKSAKQMYRDVMIGSIGANAAIPATFLLLTELAGTDAALTYAAVEGFLTAVPVIPGIPGVVRGIYMGLLMGVKDGVEKYKSAKKEGRDISLKKAIGKSVALGSMTSIDFGYLMVPLIVAIRNFDFEIDARGMIKILRSGYPLYTLVKKYGKVEELKRLADGIDNQSQRWEI